MLFSTDANIIHGDCYVYMMCSWRNNKRSEFPIFDSILKMLIKQKGSNSFFFQTAEMLFWSLESKTFHKCFLYYMP